jgi:hypothetical protein
MQFVTHGALVMCTVAITDSSMSYLYQGFGTHGKLWYTLLKDYMDFGALGKSIPKENHCLNFQNFGALGKSWYTLR